MGFLPAVAIALVVITVVASLYTGQCLGEVKRNVFQLEMQVEQLRRQVSDLEQDTKKTQGHVRALTRLRLQKLEGLATLHDEFRLMQSGHKEITVAAGLQAHRFELVEAAA